MAITDSDFQKIWASTSPLTPYEFSDTNYQQGWNFIGSTPPARQMWDFLQKQNDKKAQWLYNNKLSLNGGTMTGIIRSGRGAIASSSQNSDSLIILNGGYADDTGGQIVLVGENYVNNQGTVIIRPRTKSGYKELTVSPNNLTWDGKNVLTSDAFNVISANASSNATANAFVQITINFTPITGYETILGVKSLRVSSPTNLTVCSWNFVSATRLDVQLFSRSAISARVDVEIVVAKS